MGVEGVAIATGIANAVSATLIIRLLRKEKEPFRLQFRKLKIHSVELNRMLSIGIPAGVQGMIFSISNVVVQSSINSYGADAIAGSSAALNFEYYCYFIIQGFNGAAISFIAQNYGAGKIDRVRFLDLHVLKPCLLRCIQLALCMARRVFPEFLFQYAYGTPLWRNTHAYSSCNTIYCKQL